MRHAADEADVSTALERRPQWAVAGKRERPFADAFEGVGETEDVLSLDERSDAEESRRT